MTKMDLIRKKFTDLCKEHDCEWWQVYDSDLWKIIEDYAMSLDLNEQEKNEFYDWDYELGRDL